MLRAEELYSSISTQVIRTKGTREAELAKLFENSFRQVNKALVNELTELSNIMGWDIWDAIKCASIKPCGYSPFFPGLGVGGHCIPIDPQ